MVLDFMSNSSAILQKQRERFLLERFIDASLFDVEILEEREAPDFIVRAEGLLVGVEVTELFISHDIHGNTPQAHEANSAQIVAKAQQFYRESGGAPAHVSICFGPGHSLRGLNRDKSAQMLSDYVRGLNLSPGVHINARPEELDGSLPDEISFVHALGVPSFDMAHWSVARAGWVAPLTLATLQERIDAKAKRLSRYKDAIAANWLLIVADARRPSSQIEAKSDFNAQAVLSPFKRTFFYRYPDRFLELGAAE